jgi:GntR family transcriptional regulator
MTPADIPELVLQDGAAIEEQIREQVRGHVLAGRLLPGEQLPSLRTFAVELAVCPDVVRRALDRLELEGLVTTSEGSGIFVAGRADTAGSYPGSNLKQMCRDFLAQVAAQGYKPAEALAALSAILLGEPSHE